MRSLTLYTVAAVAIVFKNVNASRSTRSVSHLVCSSIKDIDYHLK